jgi:transposase
MAKSYRSWTPTQSYLLPPSPAEWLPEDHLAFFVLEVVDELDLGAIESVLQSKDARGERPYPPRLMVALLVYAYATGVFSSRAIARATYEDVAFRVIVGDAHPAFTTINQFRLDHRAALAALFHQVLRLCQAAGLVKLGHVAIDGSKLKANASKHKAMSHERMEQADARLSQEIEELLQRADEVDAAEDAKLGVGQDEQDLPAELQRREGRRAKIRAAKAALEQETRAARAEELRAQADAHCATAADPTLSERQRRTAATLAAKRDQQAQALDEKCQVGRTPPPSSAGEPSAEVPPNQVADEPADLRSSEPRCGGDDLPTDTDDLPRNHPPKRADGEPTPEAQRNFTDPDSRIMVRDGAFVQAYNVQIAVDEAHQIIVAEALTNQAPDAQHFGPMLHRVVRNCGQVPERVTGDAGYFSEENVRAAEHLGCEPFISVGRQRHDASAPAPEPKSTPMRDFMRTVLDTPEGKKAYSRRKCTVEPVFGQIFAARGFRQFLLRGLHKVRFEWTFLCLTHNLLKLFRRFPRRAQRPADLMKVTALDPAAA